MFITFEGLDGSGKSTQVDLFTAELEAMQIEYVKTREPGGTTLAEELRSIVKNNNHSPSVAMMLFMTARLDLVERVILPALGQGKIVVCDRYYDSSLAMQGYAEGREGRVKAQIALLDLPTPDITFLLMIDPETQSKRLQDRKLDIFESRGPEYHQAIRVGFENVAADIKRTGKIFKINANLSVLDVHRQIMFNFRKKLSGLAPKDFKL